MSRFQLIPYPHFSHALRRWGNGFFFYICPSCHKALSPCLRLLELTVSIEEIDLEDENSSAVLVWKDPKCDVAGCNNPAYVEVHQVFSQGGESI